MQAALLWQPDDSLDQLRLVAPDGESLVSGASVRHIRGTDAGPNALIGVQFVNMAASSQRRVGRWLRSVENHAALRSGQASRILQESAPFLSAERTAPRSAVEPRPSGRPCLQRSRISSAILAPA